MSSFSPVGATEGAPIGSLLTRIAAENPDFPALTIGAVTYSRLELEKRANRRARALADLGVGEGDFVTIAMPNCVEFHETAFAAWKLGAIPAPVSHKLPDPELGAILDLVKPRVVAGLDSARVPNRLVLPQNWRPDPQISLEPLTEKISAHWTATTSGGSTGRPKVIVGSRRGVLDPDNPGFGMEKGDTLLNPGPLYHNAPFGFVHMGICWGLHVVEMERFDPAEALRLIERHKVNWTYFVPTMMNRIWSLAPGVRTAFDLSSLRRVMHMAAPCPAWLKERWIDWLGPDRIWELYSGTEALGSTTISGREWLEHRGSVGRLPDNGTIRLINETGEACAAREVGEIFFRPPNGQGSTYRYIGAEPKAQGEWETYGDMGWMDEDRYLYIADRRTDLIISGGANIYPAEIEAALESHSSVGSAVAVGLPDADMGQKVHAIIEVRGVEPDVGQLWDHLAGLLTRYKMPRTIEFVAEPLRNDAGKVRRSALREERIRRLATGEGFRFFQPANPTGQ